MSADAERCHICGKPMREYKGVYLCLPCNEKYGDYYNFFTSASREFQDSNDRVTIECPGVTIYDESNSRVVQGVRWHNDHDHSQGYEIVGKQIFAPKHARTRVVGKAHAHRISRCQGCQDFTIRMRIYNQQKDKVDYQQNSPLMPRIKSDLERPSL